MNNKYSILMRMNFRTVIHLTTSNHVMARFSTSGQQAEVGLTRDRLICVMRLSVSIYGHAQWFVCII